MSQEISTRHYEADFSPRSVDIFDADFVVHPTPGWFVEPGLHEHVPWQHTPLRPYEGKGAAQLRNMMRALQSLIDNVPDSVDPRLAGVIETDFLSGKARRETACAGNFQGWEDSISGSSELAMLEQDEKLSWFLGEALDGHASPGGLLELLRNAPSLHSLDLQVLTTPYGNRMEHREEMRRQLDRSVHDVGGKIYEQAPPAKPLQFAVQPLGGKQNECAVLVTQKRRISELTDVNGEMIYINERQVCMLPLLEKDGNGDAARMMMSELPLEAQPGVRDFLLKKITNERIAIPLSAMVYAYRELPEYETGEARIDTSLLAQYAINSARSTVDR